MVRTVPSAMRFRVFAGTFVLCMGLLVYEIFCSRVLTVVLGPQMVFVALALAMLGLSSAASVMSLMRAADPDPFRRDRRVSRLCVVLGLGTLALLLGLRWFDAYVDEGLEAAIAGGGVDGLMKYYQSHAVAHSMLIGLLLSGPYFLFGLAITALFESSSPEEYPRLYFADLLGAGAGCVASILVLEFGGYAAALGLVLVMPLFAAAIYAPPGAWRLRGLSGGLAIVALGLAFVPQFSSALEPTPSLNEVSRNYTLRDHVHPLWHQWHNYGRVEYFETEKGDHRFAHNRGEGHAILIPYTTDAQEMARRNPNRFPGVSARLATALQPEKVLVIFAGVGEDMIGIDSIMQGRSEITGVELNRAMVEHARALPEFRLNEFLDRPGIDLVVEEGREFIERDRSSYDSILFSWAGAGAADLMGVSGGAIQFIYTKESLEAFLDHLSPGGVMTILNLNKLQLVLMLREIFEERGWPGLDQAIVLLKPLGTGIKTAWNQPLDRLYLMVRPSGFAPTDLERIGEVARDIRYEVALAPGYLNPNYRVFDQAMHGTDPKALVREIAETTRLNLRVTTDDRPYALWLMPASLLMDPGFWRGERGLAWKLRRDQFVTLAGIMLAAVVLVLGPMFLRPGPRLTRRHLVHLEYFLCLGIGFILIETGMVMKFTLLLGNPGYSIAVVLAGLILSTGVGSFASSRLFPPGRLNFARTTLLLMAAVGLVLAIDAVGAMYLMTLPKPLKSLVVLALLFPLGFLMGQLFPQGLAVVRREDARLVPWAWAINGAFSTIAACLAVFIAPFLGYNFVIGVGVAAYALILTLPVYGWVRAEVPAADTAPLTVSSLVP